jgi:D-threo-aldose 1-dehydrogenase
LLKSGTGDGDALYKWREEFFCVCKDYNIKPAAACVQFGLHAPGVNSIDLNTTDAKKVKENIDLATTKLPASFWHKAREKRLISGNFFEDKSVISAEE